MAETKINLLPVKLIASSVDFLPKRVYMRFFSKYAQMDIERMGLMAMLPDSFIVRDHSFGGVTKIDGEYVVSLYKRLAKDGTFPYSNIELRWERPWEDDSVEEIVMDKEGIEIGLIPGTDTSLNRLPQNLISLITRLRDCAEEDLFTLDINAEHKDKNLIILGCGPKNEQK